VKTAGAFTMPVYLWQMVPVVVVVGAGYLSVVGDPAVGGALWWAQRPIWIITLSLVLAGCRASLPPRGPRPPPGPEPAPTDSGSTASPTARVLIPSVLIVGIAT